MPRNQGPVNAVGKLQERDLFKLCERMGIPMRIEASRDGGLYLEVPNRYAELLDEYLAL
jgi:hypothetical protein